MNDALLGIMMMCEYNISSSTQFTISSNISDMKLTNAISSYAPYVSKSSVLALYDDTVWGGAREGFIITDTGIYMKELMMSPKQVLFSEMKEIHVLDKGIRFETHSGYYVDYNSPMSHIDFYRLTECIYAMIYQILLEEYENSVDTTVDTTNTTTASVVDTVVDAVVDAVVDTAIDALGSLVCKGVNFLADSLTGKNDKNTLETATPQMIETTQEDFVSIVEVTQDDFTPTPDVTSSEVEENYLEYSNDNGAGKVVASPKFCPECGAKNLGGKFCSECANKF